MGSTLATLKASMESPANPALRFRVMPFDLWREEIAPLWAMQGAYKFIPPFVNGHGQIQYVGREKFNNMLLFPIAAEYEGERIGWTSTYNVSDHVIRVRGIYVRPEYRSNGIGRQMVDYALSLWPKPWASALIYSRESNIRRYENWGFKIVQDHKLRTFEYEATFDEVGTVLMQKKLHERNSEQKNLSEEETLKVAV